MLASMIRSDTFVFNINQKQSQLKFQNISKILMSVLCKPLLYFIIYYSKSEEKEIIFSS